MVGYIHSYETFGAVDGPGVRFVFFFQGCPMRCLYCHNPDTRQREGGTPMETEACVALVKQYKHYLKRGGVTLSGGEPLLQWDFAISLARALKAEGVHVAVDTSGVTFQDTDECKQKFAELLPLVDLFLLDIKEMDAKKHLHLTGHGNEGSLAFARFLDAQGKPMWIRYVLVPALTDAEADLRALRHFLDTLTHVEKVEVLPYHTLGKHKYDNMGIPYPLEGVLPPDKESVAWARQILNGPSD